MLDAEYSCLSRGVSAEPQPHIRANLFSLSDARVVRAAQLKSPESHNCRLTSGPRPSKEFDMKALCWHGKNDVRIDKVPDPKIEDPGDIVIRVTSTAICGSDLHLLDGYMSGMQKGDILGHEFMGEVVEVGSDVSRFNKGDRVVVPFVIACGKCFFCNRNEHSLCDRSNREPDKAREMLGHATAGLFGYSHLTGGFAGGQAEYVRVPMAEHGPIKIPDGLADERVLFLSDILPTGYMAAEQAQIEDGDTVAVWGCGPVAQFCIQSAWMFGAGRVIAIDEVKERLALAENVGRAETMNFRDVDIYDALMEATGGRGPDRCIDAVGCEAHGANIGQAMLDKAKEATMLQQNRNHVLNEMILSCRKGGTISVPGVYTATVDGLMMGSFMNKALTLKTGQTHVQRYLEPLLKKIENDEFDPAAIITHRLKLDDAPEAYKTFRDKKDGCIKVVMTP